MPTDKRYLFIDTHRIRGWEGDIYQRFPKPEKLVTTGLEGGVPGSCDARGPTIYGSVLKEGDLYRMWYTCMPDAISHGEEADHFYSCYAESDDGIAWRKPDLKITGQERFPGNHLLSLPGGLMGVVPTLPGADSKYFAAVMQYKIEDDISAGFGYADAGPGTYIYASDDGLHWRQHTKEPICCWGDVCSLTVDPATNRYLLYQKVCDLHGLLARRTFAFLDSEDGLNWSGVGGVGMVPWRESLQCDDYDDLQAVQAGYLAANHYDVSVYRAGKTLISVEDIFQMGSPLRPSYTQSPNGRFMFRLGFSHDGVIWRYPKGRPTWLEPGSPDEWDAGFGVTANTFIEQDDHLLLYYTGTPYPHGWYINTDFSLRDDIPLEAQRNSKNILIARMRKDRFGCLASGYEGKVYLDAGPRDAGDALFINARCLKRGIRVALHDLNTNKPIPGYTFDDAVPFTGDDTRAPVTFRNAETADLPVDQPLMVHFEIAGGEVFGYEWAQA